jgi:HAD superfamily hydrolase (TIGR01509 family)
MDGVIVQSEEAHIQAEKQIMLKRGVTISAEELHRYTGSTAKYMFSRLKENYGLENSVEDLEMEKEDLLLKLMQRDMKPTEGVILLIRQLKQRGVKLALASGSSRRVIDHVLSGLEIRSFFDAIVGAEDVGKSKPDPEVFIEAATRLKIKPEECVVVEDANLGVLAAKRAGMKCVGYRNPESGEQDLSAANITIDSFIDLDVDQLLS